VRLGGRARHRHRNCQDRVRSQAAFVLGAIERDHVAVDHGLLLGFHAYERWSDFLVDVAHRLARALAEVARLVAIAQFHRFVLAGGCAGRHRRPPPASIGQINVGLDGRIPAAVQNFASYDACDFHDELSEQIFRWNGLSQTLPDRAQFKHESRDRAFAG
jgi:hypothetical protein